MLGSGHTTRWKKVGGRIENSTGEVPRPHFRARARRLQGTAPCLTSAAYRGLWTLGPCTFLSSNNTWVTGCWIWSLATLRANIRREAPATLRGNWVWRRHGSRPISCLKNTPCVRSSGLSELHLQGSRENRDGRLAYIHIFIWGQRDAFAVLIFFSDGSEQVLRDSY